jgi:hypothetical protein
MALSAGWAILGRAIELLSRRKGAERPPSEKINREIIASKTMLIQLAKEIVLRGFILASEGALNGLRLETIFLFKTSK